MLKLMNYMKEVITMRGMKLRIKTMVGSKCINMKKEYTTVGQAIEEAYEKTKSNIGIYIAIFDEKTAMAKALVQNDMVLFEKAAEEKYQELTKMPKQIKVENYIDRVINFEVHFHTDGIDEKQNKNYIYPRHCKDSADIYINMRKHHGIEQKRMPVPKMDDIPKLIRQLMNEKGITLHTEVAQVEATTTLEPAPKPAPKPAAKPVEKPKLKKRDKSEAPAKAFAKNSVSNQIVNIIKNAGSKGITPIEIVKIAKDQKLKSKNISSLVHFTLKECCRMQHSTHFGLVHQVNDKYVYHANM